jgi:hypothetical protein
LIALATIQLGGLARVVSQSREHRVGCREETVFTSCRCQLVQAWAEDETALHVASDQTVVFERNRQAVRGRAR